MKNNVILIGMPGAGKSTVGVVLAKTLGYDFIDTDILMCRRTGMTLQTYIDRYGIDAFLNEEEQTALSIECENTVIATGGSMVFSDTAMRRLKSGSVTVFFDVPLPELKKRLENIRTRGIAAAAGQTIDDIYRQRLPLYRKYADITLPPEPMVPWDHEENRAVTAGAGLFDLEGLVQDVLGALQQRK